MRITRILVLSAATLMGVGLLLAPPAAAAPLEVNCASGLVERFTVSSGQVIEFDMDTPSCDALLAYLNVDSEAEFDQLIEQIADTRGTGGIAVPDYDALLVTYTAGPRSGTDSLVLPSALLGMGARLFRGNLDLIGAWYYMTVPAGPSGPPTWLQAIGRPDHTADCPFGYGPSWAEWPNDRTGGWVCVREYYYSPSLADWAYRRG